MEDGRLGSFILLSKATIPNYRPQAPSLTVNKFVWWVVMCKPGIQIRTQAEQFVNKCHQRRECGGCKPKR